MNINLKITLFLIFVFFATCVFAQDINDDDFEIILDDEFEVILEDEDDDVRAGL